MILCYKEIKFLATSCNPKVINVLKTNDITTYIYIYIKL